MIQKLVYMFFWNIFAGSPIVNDIVCEHTFDAFVRIANNKLGPCSIGEAKKISIMRQ